MDDLAGHPVAHAYRAAYDSLHMQAKRFTRCPESAHDIVQDAFANTLIAIESGNQVEDLNAWLRRCVHNLGVNHVTRRKSTELLSENLAASDSGSVVKTAAARERCQEILDVVDSLTPEQRTAFVLAELRGLDYSVIAADLRRSVDATRHLVARARRRIRKSVGADESLALVFGMNLDQPVWNGFKQALARIWGPVAQKISNLQATVSSHSPGSEIPFQHGAVAVAAVLVAGIPGAFVGNQQRAVGAPQHHAALAFAIHRSATLDARHGAAATRPPRPHVDQEALLPAPGETCVNASHEGGQAQGCGGSGSGIGHVRNSGRTAPVEDGPYASGSNDGAGRVRTADVSPPANGEAPPDGGEPPPPGASVPPTGEAPPGDGASPPPTGEAPPGDGAPPPPTGAAPPANGAMPPSGASVPPTGEAPPANGVMLPPIAAPPDGSG